MGRLRVSPSSVSRTAICFPLPSKRSRDRRVDSHAFSSFAARAGSFDDDGTLGDLGGTLLCGAKIAQALGLEHDVVGARVDR